MYDDSFISIESSSVWCWKLNFTTKCLAVDLLDTVDTVEPYIARIPSQVHRQTSVKVQCEWVYTSLFFSVSLRSIAFVECFMPSPFRLNCSASRRYTNAHTRFKWICEWCICVGESRYTRNICQHHVWNQPKHVITWTDLFSCFVFWFLHALFWFAQTMNCYHEFGILIVCMRTNWSEQRKLVVIGTYIDTLTLSQYSRLCCRRCDCVLLPTSKKRFNTSRDITRYKIQLSIHSTIRHI